MKEWIISGGNDISGIVEINGAKNSLLAIIPACLVTKSLILLTNVPPLSDTLDMVNILRKLEIRVIYDNKDKMIIDSRFIKNKKLDGEEMRRIRASYYFMGALLSLYKNVEIVSPGGCKFASRPIDLHLFAFDNLGCECSCNEEGYVFKKGKIKNRVIEFSKVSVGATINAILASCRVEGIIRLVNVALEPEIDDLISFLNKCGGDIKREGNSIIIKGKKRYHSCNYKIMDDRIEAGTFLILGACVGNNLKIMYKDDKYLEKLIATLISIGVDIKVHKNYLIVNKVEEVKDCEIIFDSYPSIPTDLQQPLSVLMSKSSTRSVLKDKVYPSRYTQIEDLKRMGFMMSIENDSLIVNRSKNLNGAKVNCKDLRGGASLILASCMCKGISVVDGVEYINRGYYGLVKKLKDIGVNIHEKD